MVKLTLNLIKTNLKWMSVVFVYILPLYIIFNDYFIDMKTWGVKFIGIVLFTVIGLKYVKRLYSWATEKGTVRNSKTKLNVPVPVRPLMNLIATTGTIMLTFFVFYHIAIYTKDNSQYLIDTTKNCMYSVTFGFFISFIDIQIMTHKIKKDGEL